MLTVVVTDERLADPMKLQRTKFLLGFISLRTFSYRISSHGTRSTAT